MATIKRLVAQDKLTSSPIALLHLFGQSLAPHTDHHTLSTATPQVAACSFASPQLSFTPSPCPPELEHGCQFEGVPAGPGHYQSFTIPREQTGPAKTPASGKLFSTKSTAMPGNPNPFYRAFCCCFCLPSLHCGYFLVKLFQGTFIFVRTLISFLVGGKHL